VSQWSPLAVRVPVLGLYSVLDQELWVLVLVIVTWVLDISLVQKESNIV